MQMRTAALPQRERLISNGMLAMLIFVIAEAMFFAGFISAFMIVRASAPMGVWPPPGQPRLPAGETAFNSVLLLLSGALLLVCYNRARHARNFVPHLAATIALGAGFVGLQGREWVAMLAQGLTLTSSAYASFFYVIVGTHAVHAVAALVVLAVALAKALRGTLQWPWFAAAGVFWYFVVGVWPLIYFRVYF